MERTLRQPPTTYVQAWFDRLAWQRHPLPSSRSTTCCSRRRLPCPAFPVGLDHPAEIAGKPITGYGWVPFTYPFNVTGQPACSVPAGFTKARLPVGLQIVGRRFDDATVLRAAAAFERARPWAGERPAID